MKKRFGILTVIVVVILVASTTLSITAGYMRSKYDKVSENLQAQEKTFEKMSEINKLLRERYIGQLDETDINNGVASGMVKGLGDAYAKYYSIEEYSRYKDEKQGKVTGFGMSVVEDTDGYMKIVRVVSGSPAADAGLKKGDVIVEIGGESTAKLGFSDACAALVGEEGTSEQFAIKRPNRTKKITCSLTRAVISVPSVEGEIIAGDVGYIKIYTFDATTEKEFSDTLDKLIEKGAAAFLFDVRQNSTGDIDVAAKVLDILLPEGPIMYKIYSDSAEAEKVMSDEASVDMPMAVVMDENTALGAELFACALSDYYKATLVGTNTFGKGTIQQMFPLSDRSAVSISVAYFNPPYSENFEGTGVTPHVHVSLTPNQQKNFYDMTYETDPQISAAVENLGRSFK